MKKLINHIKTEFYKFYNKIVTNEINPLIVFLVVLFFGILIQGILMCLTVSKLERQRNPTPNPTISQKDMFKVIYTNDRLNYYVVYDVETNVEYVVSNGLNNEGTFTMCVDSTGKPKLYKK